MLVNTTIDKTNFHCTTLMLESPWNQALQFILAAHCAEIVDVCPDKLRFGLEPIDWQSVLKDKLYRMLLAITKAQPLFGSDKTVPQIKSHLMKEHIHRKKKVAANSSRHNKVRLRAEKASIMAQKCRDRKDHDAGGMSEEEDATEEIRVGNRVQRRRYKKIRILYRRNPIVATINERVDALPHDA
ncbi:hypothetical protein F5050DRAFT_1700991, partial [Lentinula boryana]